jgi:hypothetical protein
MGRAPVQEQRENTALGHQIPGDLLGLFGIEAVVHRDQLDFLAANTAAGVDGGEQQPGTLGVLFHPGGDRAGEGRGLANEDLGRRPREKGARGEQAEQQTKGEAIGCTHGLRWGDEMAADVDPASLICQLWELRTGEGRARGASYNHPLAS